MIKQSISDHPVAYQMVMLNVCKLGARFANPLEGYFGHLGNNLLTDNTQRYTNNMKVGCGILIGPGVTSMLIFRTK